MKPTKKEYEKLLNYLGGSCECEFSINGKKHIGLYGTLLKKYDNMRFNMYYRQWIRENFRFA